MDESENLKRLRERMEQLRVSYKRAELEKTHLEKNFESAFNLLDDTIIRINNDNVIEKINDAGLKLLNANAEDVIGKKCYEVMHNADKPIENCPHQRSHQSGKTETLITFEKKIDKWIHVKDLPVFLENDEEPVYHLHLIRDITDEKRAEKELQKSEENQKIFNKELERKNRVLIRNRNLLDSLMTAIPIPVFYKDLDLKYLGCNKAFSDFFGVSSDYLKGKTVEEIWPESLASVYKSKDKELIKSKKLQVYEFQVKAKDGSIREVIYSKNVFYDENENISGIVGVFTDISENKKREAELQESKEKFRMLSENVSDGIILIEKGEINYVSRGYQKLVGLSDSEVKNINRDKLIKRIHPEDRELISQKIKDSQKALFTNFKYKYRIKFKNKDYIWVEDRVDSIFDEDGNCIVSIIHSRDISEAVEYESLLKKKKNELEKLNIAKDKLFSIIAHDLRNPFNVILGASDVMLKNIQEGNMNDLEFFAETISDSAENTYYLLENLLHWSRSQKARIDFEPEIISLEELINTVLSYTKKLADTKNITINFSVSKKIKIYADRKMTEFIVRNILTNAIKFTQSGGKIKISTKNEAQYTILVISDTGIGMSKEGLDQLFNMYRTSETTGTEKEKGTGLGLVLCKEFIERNSGEIWAESTPGKGSTFYCSFLKKPDKS